MADFQKYLQRCLWTADHNRGKKPVPFDDDRIRELLHVVLHLGYAKQMTDTTWDLNVHSYEESVSKIVGLQPSFKLANEDSKTLSEIWNKNKSNPANVNKSKDKNRNVSTIDWRNWLSIAFFVSWLWILCWNKANYNAVMNISYISQNDVQSLSEDL